MTRETYLQELWARLSNRMPRQELDNVMHYYEEYFDEAGPQQEAEVIAELGTPEHLAAQVMGDRFPEERQAAYGGPASYEPRQEHAPRGKWTGGQLAALICLSPIWAPVGLALLIVAFVLVVVLTVALFSIVLGFGAGGIGCVAGGLMVAVCGLSALFTPGVPTVIFFLGGGFVTAGLGLLLLLAAIWMAVAFAKATAAMWKGFCGGTAACFRLLFRRSGNEVAA